MRYRNLWAVGLISLLSISFAVVGCDKKGQATSEPDKAQEGQSEESATKEQESQSNRAEDDSDKRAENKEAEDGSDKPAPSADIYPGIQLNRLSGADRKTVVQLAKGELCPCPDANQSLHKCLQSKKKRCGVAERIGGLMAVMVKKGKSKTDIRDRVVKYVEAANKTYDFTLSDVPAKGPKDAPVKIVEFADFECPACRQATGVIDKVYEKMKGKVRVYFKHFPLPNHPNAKFAAKASMAAHKQGKFWPMHDLLFEKQNQLSRERIKVFARQIGVNFSKFKRDLQSPEVAALVQRDQKEAREANVTSTPTIFVNGKRYLGGLSEKALTERIESAIKNKKD